MRLAVVLFNLGGPDSPEAVEPFLRNLFSDPAIISLPGIVRKPLAKFIARRRAPIATEIYAKIGGSSPILAETQAQARSLDAILAARGYEAHGFIAMRCWHPFSDGAAKAVKDWGADKVVLLPLYPQYSTTTTASSIRDWHRAAKKAGLVIPQARVCCYPTNAGFIAAMAEAIHETRRAAKPGLEYRILFSAHGLPERVIAKGDPYQWQIEQTAAALVEKLGIEGLDWQVCYQSRVGPMRWIAPSTDDEVRRAGRDGKGVIIAPVAFVSEHSETLVELDMEYAHLASNSGVPDYLRVPTVSVRGAFIEGLADLVVDAAEAGGAVTSGVGRLCPATLARCGFAEVTG